MVKMRKRSNTDTEPIIKSSIIDQNNIHDEINSFMSKGFAVEKNVARSSMYKHFNDESLYHGVNLNLPRQRCSCSHIESTDLLQSNEMYISSSKYQFNHRNIQLSYEDKENLENEAMEVYCNLAYYDTSF